jgi:hypothetical protein
MHVDVVPKRLIEILPPVIMVRMVRILLFLLGIAVVANYAWWLFMAKDKGDKR